MKWFLAVTIVASCVLVSTDAQFGGGGFRGFFRGFGRGFGHMQHMFNHHVARPVTSFMPHFRMPHFFGGHHGGHGGHHGGHHGGNNVGNTADKATKEPQATGNDKVYPDDCGRDDKNKGLLCFPDGLLCQNRKDYRFSLGASA